MIYLFILANLNKNNGCMKNIFTNLYIAVKSEYLDVFCWFMFVPILSITNHCYSWWFLISTTSTHKDGGWVQWVEERGMSIDLLTVSQRWNVPEETCLWLSHDLRIFLYSVPSFSVKDYTSNISPKHIKMLKWREREMKDSQTDRISSIKVCEIMT